MKLLSCGATRALLLLCVLAGAGALSAVPLTMEYQVKDLGGGTYQYDFTLKVDNNDGSYATGQGWRWLIIGDDATTGQLTNWKMSTGQFPVGPWTGNGSSGGGHNGTDFSYVLDYWIPSGIGDSLNWRGTSTADLPQGKLLWSTLAGTQGGAVAANFAVANRIDPGVATFATKGTASNVPPDEDGGGNGFEAGKFTIENNSALSATVTDIQIQGFGTGDHTSAYTEFAIYRDQTASGTVGSFDTGDVKIGTGTFSGSPATTKISISSSSEQTFAVGTSKQYFIVVKLNGSAKNAQTLQYKVSDLGVGGSTTKYGAPTNTMAGLNIVAPPKIGVKNPGGSSITNGGSDSVGGVLTFGSTFTYTIENTGIGALDLTGTPLVAISSASNVNASVSAQPSTPVAISGSTTFDLDVQPVAAGAFSFDVTIASNDTTQNPFTFTVTGTGVSNQPPAISIPSGSNWTQNGADYELVVNPGASYNDDLEIDDPTPDNFTVAVTAPGAIPSTMTNAPASITSPTAGPITLNWAGTADASNTPGAYTWQIAGDDSFSTASYNCSIIIVDLAPTHSIGTDATAGNGQASGTAYTGQALVGSTAALTLADVSDPNTSQTPTLAGVTPDGGNPTGGSGFNVTLVAASIVATPTAALTLSDVGTYIFGVDVTDGNNTTTVYIAIDVVTPEIDVSNATPTAIPDGGTDTVTGALAGQPLAVTYTIANNGTYDLTITTVATSNTTNCSASVTANPGSPVTPGNTTTFDVTVTPTAAGAFSFDIAINNDDVDENPYDITVNGTAIAAPEIELSRSATPIADGGSDTLGSIQAGTSKDFVYTIANTGTSDLTISSVTTSGATNCTATVTSNPGGTVTPGNTTTFTIRVVPTAAGPFLFSFAIANNDANENPYDVNASGTGTTVTTTTGGGKGGGGGGCSGTGGGSLPFFALLALALAGITAIRRRRA